MPAACATIDLSAIQANAALLCAAARTADVMAVVKADAYGHGAVETARAALQGGARWLGTANIEEALQLRRAGILAPLLCWLNTPGAQWKTAIAARVDLSAADLWAIDEIIEAAAQIGLPARVHLKVDSGLGRGGAPMSAWPVLVEAALKAEADGLLEVVGLWSHLGASDDPRDARSCRQIEVFQSAVYQAERAGICPEVRHLANSTATLLSSKAHFDLVRPGIALYGLWPQVAARPTRLRPAMTLSARLAQVKEVPAGHCVSYGSTYTTTRPTRLGIVPLGYADGVPRHAGNIAPVYIAGQWRPIAGRVCMDQFVIDLGDIDADPGDEVVLYGPGDRGEPTAAHWARLLGTITNELVTGVGPRVARRYR
ncbi:alanine racemase [Streptomyces purpurogeneiscleroticus]|uniref:alanine racemase n=1 Tax=Streptomyces purpurogeneiscleroticus TaxID=68259 RepID=UPI001CBCC8C2|nr:alanine racemase [Streptomyces purpurogeneiscleroticus]MBZ4016066.1 alanine racemase [Streptomyces purpurogeneiscleroticus]